MFFKKASENVKRIEHDASSKDSHVFPCLATVEGAWVAVEGVRVAVGVTVGLNEPEASCHKEGGGEVCWELSVQCSAVQCTALHCSAVQYSAVMCCSVAVQWDDKGGDCRTIGTPTACNGP